MWIFINARVCPGVYAVLYRHGKKYAITDYSSGSKEGKTDEFDTVAEANTFRENLGRK